MNRQVSANWTPAPAQAAPAAGSVSFGHAYNKANQRIGQTVTDNSWINYPAATASTTSYTANALNQYTAVGAVTPGYDGNGNLTSDGTFTLGYDAENRLVSASGAGNTASYTFDAQGRRKTKTVNGATTVFVTDADNREVLEYDGGTGAVQRWYAYGLGPNAVLNQMNVAAATRATLVPDILGSVVGTMDSAAASLSKVGYLPYGKSGSAGPFGFTGQRIDVETNGLYYYRARHYSPAWGRFLQVDPTGYSAGPHLYAYVSNDPLNLLDPMGLAGEAPQASGASYLSFLAPVPGIAADAGATVTAAAAAATGVLAAAVVVATTVPTAGRDEDQVQYVVRGGTGAAKTFEQGTALTTNGFGFSVQTAPNVTINELARGGYFPNGQVSVSTVLQLQSIPGVTVTFPTPGRGDYHGTVNVPNPPPPGLFDAISAMFQPRPNPYPVPRR